MLAALLPFLLTELPLGYSSTGGCGPVVAGFQFHFEASLPQLLHGDHVVVPYRPPPPFFFSLLFPFSNLLKFFFVAFFFLTWPAFPAFRPYTYYIIWCVPSSPVDLLRFPSFRWRQYGGLSIGTVDWVWTHRERNRKKPTINYRSWELAVVYLKHANDILGGVTWGKGEKKGLCIHLLALLDAQAHPKADGVQPFFFFFSFRISGHPYHVQSTAFTRI